MLFKSLFHRNSIGFLSTVSLTRTASARFWPDVSRWAAILGNGYSLLGLSFLLSFFLRLPYFQHDFIFIDEAWWANGARAWLQGDLLYRDIWLDKNPPIFVLCGLLFRFFGVHMDAIHFGSLALVLGISLLLFAIGTTFWNRRVGGLAALFYAIASTTYYIPRIIGMNTETLMVAFTTAAVFFFLLGLKEGHRTAFFLAGLLSSLGFLTKPVAITQVGLFGLFLLLKRDGPQKICWRELLCTAGGYSLGLLAMVSYLQSKGILEDWWNQAILYGFRYVGAIPWDTYLINLVRKSGAFMMIYLWLFLLIAAALFRQKSYSLQMKVLALWAAADAIGALAGRRLYANYFIQAIPSLSLLGAVGAHFLAGQWEKKNSRRVLQWSMATFLIVFTWFHTRTLFHWWTWLTPSAQHSHVRMWDMHKETRQLQSAADFIRSRTEPRDKLFIWGSKSQLYFLTGRDWAVPSMDFDVADDVPPRVSTREVRLAAIESLKQAPPKYIIDVQQKLPLEKDPDFKGFVEQHYDLEKRFGEWRLFRLREAEGG